jgi:hypothetical protein
MKAPRFRKWFASLPALNQPQRQRVLDALRPAAGLHALLALMGWRRALDGEKVTSADQLMGLAFGPIHGQR